MGNHEVKKWKKQGTAFVVDGVKWQQKIRLLFELTNKKHTFYKSKGSQPFVVGREYTFSFYPGKSDLAKLVSNWTAIEVDTESQKAFEEGTRSMAKEFLGEAGMVTVIHDETNVWYKHKTDGSTVIQAKVDENPTAYDLEKYWKNGGRKFATIGTVGPIPDIITPEQIGKAENPLINFDFDGDNTEMREAFKKLPKFMREKIALASEYNDFFGDVSPEPEGNQQESQQEKPSSEEEVLDDLPF